MYWIITPFLMMLILSLIQKWSVGGLSIDTEESKIIQRTFDDKTTISTILFGYYSSIIFFYSQIHNQIFLTYTTLQKTIKPYKKYSKGGKL